MRIENGSLVISLRNCTVRASILRVPDDDGRGAYVAEVCFGGDRDFVETAGFRSSVSVASQDLVAMLDRHDITVTRVPWPRLVYGGAWVAGELERQPGYDPMQDPCRRKPMPTVPFREILGLLELYGWNLDSIWSQYRIFKKPGLLEIMIPVSNGQVDTVYVSKIERILTGSGYPGGDIQRRCQWDAL